MLVIGEKINGSIKSVALAIEQKDPDFIAELARNQANAGAHYIDVNAGTGLGSLEEKIKVVEWLVESVQTATDKPLVIDSDDPEIIRAALKQYRGENALVNSVTAESERLTVIGTMAAEHQASVVALAMGEEGIPDNVAQRISACDKILKYLNKLGIPAEQVYFDPLVLPISVDSRQAQITLDTLASIKSEFPGSKTVMGLSNISYGLPNRKVINRAFLAMSAHAGLDAVICNPLDAQMMSMIKVSDLLTNQDPSCRGYLRASRQGKIME